MGMVKTAQELLDIAKAEAIGDRAFEHILGFIRIGMTELEIAKEIEKTMFSLGATDLSFPTISVSGWRGCLPHGEPSEKRIEEGELLTLDFGCIYNGQCGDMTRTVGLGELSEKQIQVYNTVLDAQEAAISAVKAGVMSREVDKIARDFIEKAGYGQFYIHGTGHGVGKQVHEEPYINKSTNTLLEENMAVTIEPGIYLPDEMGVRIEDLAIITEFGIINLTKSPKELIIL